MYFDTNSKWHETWNDATRHDTHPCSLVNAIAVLWVTLEKESRRRKTSTSWQRRTSNQIYLVSYLLRFYILFSVFMYKYADVGMHMRIFLQDLSSWLEVLNGSGRHRYNASTTLSRAARHGKTKFLRWARFGLCFGALSHASNQTKSHRKKISIIFVEVARVEMGWRINLSFG